MTYSETLEKEILKKISVAENQDSLEKIRIAELGKKEVDRGIKEKET